MRCPRCQAENPETVKFCGECGTPLEGLEMGGHEPNSPGFGIVSPHSQSITFALNPDGSIDQAKMRAVSPETDFSFDSHDLLLKPAKKPAEKTL